MARRSKQRNKDDISSIATKARNIYFDMHQNPKQCYHFGYIVNKNKGL